MSNRTKEVKHYYFEYYKGRPLRNDLMKNPQVLFQILATEASFVSAVKYINHDPHISKVLDVGCGDGANLFQLLRLKYNIENISGIDINDTRLDIARRIYPNVDFRMTDASSMPFDDSTFDLVHESTMFATLSDDGLCQSIANEFVRVCKPGGYIILVDWRYKKPQSPNYNALNLKKLKTFFGVGTKTELISVQNGALVPPIGRFISKNIPSLYFLIAKIFPFLVGQVVYLLIKRNN